MMMKFLWLLLLTFLTTVSNSSCAGTLQDLLDSSKVKTVIEKHDYDHEIAVLAIFQDEAPYLKEWIEYYKLLGVSHFYLYNNLSEDNYLEVLLPYMETHEVEVFDWPYACNNVNDYDVIQCNAYRDSLQKALGKVKWLAIIDIDEFFVPVRDNSLIDLLKKYESRPEIGGICGVWIFFGTSHVEQISADSLMIEVLQYNGGAVTPNFWQAGFYKSIVRPERVSYVISPHYCLYKNGIRHEAMPYDIMQMNHYWTRDENFLNNVKIPRREKWGFSANTTLAWANGMNLYLNPFNAPILRFVPALKINMGLPNEN